MICTNNLIFRRLSMPKELNFFDTNPVVYYYTVITLGILRKEMPIWDRNLYVSLCIEVLESKAHTEPTAAARIPKAIIVSKDTSTSTITVMAPTTEDWIARTHEVRVV